MNRLSFFVELNPRNVYKLAATEPKEKEISHGTVS
jgi:hypothetical protein